MIKFEKNRYTVNEPIIKGDTNILRIPVVRLGDTSGTSEVRVSTKSGSARAGRDFNGYSKGKLGLIFCISKCFASALGTSEVRVKMKQNKTKVLMTLQIQ